MDAPSYVTTTSTTLLLKWPEVKDVGGCPITGYSVFRDDKMMEPADLSLVDSSNKTIPTLRELAVPLSSSDSQIKAKTSLSIYMFITDP